MNQGEGALGPSAVAMTLEELERRMLQSAPPMPASQSRLPALPPLAFPGPSQSLWSWGAPSSNWSSSSSSQVPDFQAVPSPPNAGFRQPISNPSGRQPGGIPYGNDQPFIMPAMTGAAPVSSARAPVSTQRPFEGGMPNRNAFSSHVNQGPQVEFSVPLADGLATLAIGGDKRAVESSQKSENRARFEWEAIGTMDVRPTIAAPDEYIDVVWEVPASHVSRETLDGLINSQRKAGGNRDSEQGDWIGMFRSRQRIDDASNHILTRETMGRATLDNRTGIVRGKVRLRAPRGVGTYDFRYFAAVEKDGLGTGENRRLPLARSPLLTVAVQGSAIVEALHFIEKNLKDKRRFSAAAQQLATLLRQISDLRSPRQQNVRPEDQERKILDDCWRVISFCVEKGVQYDYSLYSQIEHLREKVASAQAEYEQLCGDLNIGELEVDLDQTLEDESLDQELDVEGRLQDEGGVNVELPSPAQLSSDNELQKTKRMVWGMLRRDLAQTERDRAAVASSVKSLIDDITANHIFFRLLSDQRRRVLHTFCTRYSVVEERFFPDENAVREHACITLGITLWSDLPDGRIEMSPQRATNLEYNLQGFLDPLIPGARFYEERRSVIKRLQTLLDDMLAPLYGVCVLHPFGSSANSFGNPDSDLDLCLVFQNRQLLSGSEASEAVSRVAEILVHAGYEHVDDARKTARIPIVKFVDPVTHIECDICMNNPLAIRNTLLLRTYGSIDERARKLVYFVKAWAKRRDLNDPSRHTLSSYGWILLCINYLQRIGLLPVLQNMPVQMPQDARGPFLPRVMVPGADGKLHDSYFFGDPESPYFTFPQAREAAAFDARRRATMNNMSVGEIISGFFWDFANSDWRRFVCSVKSGGFLFKVNKAAEDSWRLHPRCAIEDPFETSYDVGHVLRDSTFKRARLEAARAYALLSGCYKDMERASLFDSIAKVLEEVEHQPLLAED